MSPVTTRKNTMSITDSKLRENYPSRQKKYRKTQRQKGLVRYEIQVTEESKARFEAAVSAAANDYTLPYSEKARKAKARTQIFEKITAGIIHQFKDLETKIESLKAEIRILSPSFFKMDLSNKISVPEAITALPDDPIFLKKILAKTYLEAQQAKLRAEECKQHADQFEKLYNAQYDYNKELESKIIK